MDKEYEYEIVQDLNGKPYSEKVNTENELYNKIEEMYKKHGDDTNFDFKVYWRGVDISESQMVQEMVAEVMEVN